MATPRFRNKKFKLDPRRTAPMKSDAKERKNERKAVSFDDETATLQIDNKASVITSLFQEEARNVHAKLKNYGYSSLTLEDLDYITPIYHKKIGYLDFIPHELETQPTPKDDKFITPVTSSAKKSFKWGTLGIFSRIFEFNEKARLSNYRAKHKLPGTLTDHDLSHQLFTALTLLQKKILIELHLCCHHFVMSMLGQPLKLRPIHGAMKTNSRAREMLIHLENLHKSSPSKVANDQIIKARNELLYVNLALLRCDDAFRKTLKEILIKFATYQAPQSLLKNELEKNQIRSISDETIECILQLEKKGVIEPHLLESPKKMAGDGILLKKSHQSQEDEIDYSLCGNYLLGRQKLPSLFAYTYEQSSETLPQESKLLSPARKTLSPESELLSPERDLLSPAREISSPESQLLSRERDLLSPARKTLSPESEPLSPGREPLSPESEPLSPERETVRFLRVGHGFY